MPRTLRLLNRDITLEEALSEDDDILHEISYPQKRLDFYYYLLEHRDDLEQLVSFHLRVPREKCLVARDFKEWIHGSFNACIPVYVDVSPRFSAKKVFMRFPLPYKVGESEFPGNAEEKLRCEVATYIWIQTHHPDVPIPSLRGFGFAHGRSFTAPENAPFLARFALFLRRTVSWLFGYPLPSRYISRRPPLTLDICYLIVDAVKEGEMLSKSWNSQRHDQDKRANLFKDMSRIMLSLAQSPFPRIGSLKFDDHGIISLTNRPLTCTLQQLENQGIPTDISRSMTYPTSDTYLSDTLAYHDNRMRCMPNAIHHTRDGQNQLSALTMMRALLRHFSNRDLRHGPFVLMLTDLHQSNIFVNEDWHITSLIDLEWACVRPVEMQIPPYWITGRWIDGLDDQEELEAFGRVYAEFTAAFELEERCLGKVDTPHTKIMRRCWEMGSFWYFSALDSPKGLHNVYMSHIQQIFARIEDSSPSFNCAVSAYWTPKAADFIAAKLKDHEVYSNQLRERFEAVEAEDSLEKPDTATGTVVDVNSV